MGKLPKEMSVIGNKKTKKSLSTVVYGKLEKSHYFYGIGTKR